MTTTAPVLKLTKGSRSLNLNSGRYKIGINFTPPIAELVSQYSGAISANRTGGASLVGQFATNRNFSFDVEVSGSSEAEIRRGLQDVATFLTWAGDESDPLYLEYSPNSDTPEPLWGNYGTNLRYEILDGTITPDTLYMTADLRGDTLPKCRISLTIKPFALGKKQRLASAMGTITQDITGTTDGISRGVIIGTSTITQESIKLLTAADTFDDTAGAIRVCFTPNANSGSSTQYFFDTTDAVHPGALQGYLDDGTIYLIGGGASISGALSWSANNKIVTHFTWGPSGLAIYNNGTVVVTGASYTEGTAGTSIYVGSDHLPLNKLLATINDFAIFDSQLTATQVLNDYTNIAPIMADGQRVGCVPYLWTKDGDNVVDNCYDDTHDNWAIAVGIPGSDDAETEFDGDLSSNWSTIKTLWINKVATDDYFPASNLFLDASGTADANACGGQHEVQTIDTSGYSWTVSVSSLYNQIMDNECYLFARLSDAGSALVGRPVFVVSNTYTGQSTNITSVTSFRTWVSAPLSMMPFHTAAGVIDIPSSVGLRFNAYRTATSGDLSVDYVMAMPRPLMRIRESSLTSAGIYYKGKAAYAHGASSENIQTVPSITGDTIELSPNKYNLLMVHMGDTDVNPVITYTFTFDEVSVIPHWSLL